MPIENEIVAGSGTSWTLSFTPISSNSVALYGAGIRLTPGAGNDYTISGRNITTAASYSAGQLLAAYTPASVSPSVIGTDTLSPYALTTLQRVKDIIFDPNRIITLTSAHLTSGSADVTGFTVPAGKTIQAGQVVIGAGIPTGTTIGTIISATEFFLSQNATATTTASIFVIDQPTAFDNQLVRLINWATNYINHECGRFSFVQQTYTNEVYSIQTAGQKYLLLRNTPVFSLTSFQYRAGTPSNPNWTDFIADQYELIDPEPNPANGGALYYPKGIIRVYGVLPQLYNNMIRATYTGGYPVSWANPEDQSTHMLPGDITNVCENLVVRRFKRRQLAGMSSQALEGATHTWRNSLDQEDLDVLGQYRDVHF